MSAVTLRWIGDLDQDKREQAGCVSSTSDQYRPKKIEFKPDQNLIRIGRNNTKNPPDYPIESCINSRMISRNHATIERSAKGGSILYDHSMNGTYVNYYRVMGGVSLKEGDIVCFGHLNGANLKPGDNVASFHSDLKYRVEISDASPNKKEPTSSTKKRKMRPSQTGSTVSSTQQSGDDDSSSSDIEMKIKSIDKKSKKRKARDEDSKDSKRISSKLPKAPAFGGGGRTKSKHESDRNRSARREKSVESDVSADAAAHADQDNCSARPCKNPQDASIYWIQCDSCERWYHQICLGISIPENSTDDYHCPYCKRKP